MACLCSAFFVFTYLVLSCHHARSLVSPTSTTASLSKHNTTDRQALVSFKSMISRDPRRSLASWNDSIHFCWWLGVTCGGRRHPQRVVSLKLTSLDLVGFISPAVANLTFLRNLDLSDNQIYGSIPQEIGCLAQLQHLNLSVNSLEGGIPATLSHCSKLKVISLQNNTLQGDIPVGLYNCSGIQILSLLDNNLTGRIPPSLTILSSLSVLSLSRNNLTGGIPPTIGNLTSLTKLHLSVNSLTGSIPPAIGNLFSLTVLVLDANHFSGDIPSSLGKLSKLKKLALSFNNLSGLIPPSLWNISSLSHLSMSFNYYLSGSLPPYVGHALPLLEEIDLNTNQFHGIIPVSLSNASGLRYIDLSVNRFNGIIPPDLGSLQNLQFLGLEENNLEVTEPNGWTFLTTLSNCTQLMQLYLNSNNFSGMLPNSIANLSTNLQYLDMGMNYMSGKLPPTIGNLANLIVFVMDTTLLTGPIPPSIGMLQKLHVLYLYRNKLSGEIPSTIGNLTQLISLRLDFNDLTRDIPASLGNCRNLELLVLGSNKLTGAIPKEILTISTLSIGLDLATNSLTGLIPTEIGSLRNLGIIDLSKNNLSGKIPSTLGECQVLEKLYLAGNFLQGSIPTSFGSLRGMRELDVSENNLSGKIPYFLQDFRVLYYLNLSFNSFEGEVPRLGVFQNASAVSVIGNNKLCGGNPELHLPACLSQSLNKKHGSFTLALIFGITGSFVILIVLFSFLIIRCRIRSSRIELHDSTPINERHEKVSYAELVKATDGFSRDNIIGNGSFGTVYKGMLGSGDSKKAVAVKVLNLQTKGASKSFLAECEAMRNIRHRNLVKILTTCSSVDFRGNVFKALVFEFIDNGCLDDWLHPKASEHFKPKKLKLMHRLDIAIDVASALDYLHNQVATPIIHCDLKPRNILLDEDMTAHVGDFGLARFLTETVSKSSQCSTSSAGLKGTVGYIAPEYGMANKVSTCGDVYSFGILMLEMFTGKRPTDDTFTGGLSLRNFVVMAFPERITDVIDTHLLLDRDFGSSVDAGNMTRVRAMECIASVLRIGISCSNELPDDRMEMGAVIKVLHSVRDVFVKNGSHEDVKDNYPAV